MSVIRVGLTPAVSVFEILTLFHMIRSDDEHANREFRYMTGWLLHFRGERTQRIPLRASSC